MRILALLLLIIFIGGCINKEEHLDSTQIKGTFHHIESFYSAHVEDRPVDIWLPDGYEKNKDQQYSVMYLHDGQFMFDQPTSPFNKGVLMKLYSLYVKLRYESGFFWDVDKTVARLIEEGSIDPIILVSVYNLAKVKRRTEYMPQKMITEQIATEFLHKESDIRKEDITSDKYLRFLVDELKPYVDQNYRTKSDQSNTFIMGSSMGGMISAYAISEYPEVFGGAACLSTHWPLGGNSVTSWYENHWPQAGNHRIYFDRGTESYDSTYGPGQAHMDSIMDKNGVIRDKDWRRLVFEGESHTPSSWRKRLHIPLEFLLSSNSQK